MSALFGTVPHELHRQRRAAISPLFSKSAASAAVPMIYDHVDLLLKRMDRQIAFDGIAEMRMNYLALATDNVAKYSTGQSRGLLQDEKQAFLWRESVRSLAEWTLVGRHFSWVIPLIFKMPMTFIKAVGPNFARIVGLHEVRTFSSYS